MKPRTPKKSGDIVVNPKKEKGKGTAIWYQDRYQLAPAVTKNAPDRNLRTSFQMLFIKVPSKHSYYRLVLTRNLLLQSATTQSTLTPDEMSALHRGFSHLRLNRDLFGTNVC